MKLLIADDDVFFRRLLERVLEEDYQVIAVEDGEQAWNQLQGANAPELAIFDWVMPKFTGPQLCRKVRESRRLDSVYLVILTAKNDTASLVSALEAGADDYITKPFQPSELRARMKVGARVLELQNKLAAQAVLLEGALSTVDQLQKLLPICPVCRAVRLDTTYADAVETYLREHPHSLDQVYCPSCSLHLADPARPVFASEWEVGHDFHQ